MRRGARAHRGFSASSGFSRRASDAISHLETGRLFLQLHSTTPIPEKGTGSRIDGSRQLLLGAKADVHPPGTGSRTIDLIGIGK